MLHDIEVQEQKIVVYIYNINQIIRLIWPQNKWPLSLLRKFKHLKADKSLRGTK